MAEGHGAWQVKGEYLHEFQYSPIHNENDVDEQLHQKFGKSWILCKNIAHTMAGLMNRYNIVGRNSVPPLETQLLHCRVGIRAVWKHLRDGRQDVKLLASPYETEGHVFPVLKDGQKVFLRNMNTTDLNEQTGRVAKNYRLTFDNRGMRPDRNIINKFANCKWNGNWKLRSSGARFRAIWGFLCACLLASAVGLFQFSSVNGPPSWRIDSCPAPAA